MAGNLWKIFGRFEDSRSARKDTSLVNYLVIYGSTVLQNSITSFTFLRLPCLFGSKQQEIVSLVSLFRSKDVISVMKTAEITKVVATTIMTQTTPHSALSPITVATAAAQCLAVTLTTTTATTKVSTLPSPKKGKRHEDGWKEVVRR